MIGSHKAAAMAALFGSMLSNFAPLQSAIDELNDPALNKLPKDFEYEQTDDGNFRPVRFVGHVRHANRSKHLPHQGRRECLRRRIGGFKGNSRALLAAEAATDSVWR